MEEPFDIKLHSDGKTYDAHIEMDSLHSRYRLFWLSDFSEELRRWFPNHYDILKSGGKLEEHSFPEMRFDRIDDRNYSVSWKSFDGSQQVITKDSDDWTDEELHASVTAYFGMLQKERIGEPYTKAEVNRQLREDVLSGRSKQSIEYRMANISAILENLCHPVIDGYTPRGNVGSEVGERIRTIIDQENLINLEDYRPTPDVVDLDQKVGRILKRGVVGKPKGHQAPSTSQSIHTTYDRDPSVKAWVLDNAKGVCELCGELGPFSDKKTGYHFLEEHHVVPLAEGGPDTIENAVGLCPNCHRKCHLAPESKDVRKELQQKVSRIVLS